jgi:hypothetical protein
MRGHLPARDDGGIEALGLDLLQVRQLAPDRKS